MVDFPISGVETYWWLPVLVGFVIATISGTGGVTGAFALLPFQVSILGYVTPGVTPTNLLYNVFAVPSGVWRYHREKRMVWPLAWVTIVGTLPGIVLGAYVRLKYLPDPRSFKLFVGAVLLYLGLKLVLDVLRRARPSDKRAAGSSFHVTPLAFNLREVAYEFNGQRFHAPTIPLGLFSLLVGVIGGAYGIGGGGLLSPFLVAIFRLPVHTTAGATLLGTLITSVAGVVIYMIISPLVVTGGALVMPDWSLGLLFGIGGAFGVYLSARLQKYVPPKIIKSILVAALLFIAGKYIVGYFG